MIAQVHRAAEMAGIAADRAAVQSKYGIFTDQYRAAVARIVAAGDRAIARDGQITPDIEAVAGGGRLRLRQAAIDGNAVQIKRNRLFGADEKRAVPLRGGDYFVFVKIDGVSNFHGAFSLHRVQGILQKLPFIAENRPQHSVFLDLYYFPCRMDFAIRQLPSHEFGIGGF